MEENNLSTVPPNPSLDLNSKPAGFFKKYKKPLWASLITLTVVTAGLMTWIIFFRTEPVAPAYEGEVKVSIEAPQSTPSGSQISYVVTVNNSSNTTLTDLALEVFYPRGFTPSKVRNLDKVGDDSLIPETSTTINLANMKPGSKEEITIVGTISGSVQEVKTISAKLHYRPENFRASFVAEGSNNTVLLAPELSLTLNAPVELVSGQKINYEIEIKNVSTRAFQSLVISVSYPNKFEPQFGVGGPLEGQGKDGKWKLATLAVGEMKKIIVSGVLSEDVDRESFFQAELFLEDSNGDLVSGGRVYAFTQMKPPPLSIKQELVRSQTDLHPGDDLQYKVSYENTGKIGLNDVVISVEFATNVFDFAHISSGTGQFRDNSSIGSGKVISWFPGSARELLVVQPGQRGQFQFSIPVSANLVANLQKNPVVKTRAFFQSNEMPDPVAGETIEQKVDTEANITAIAQIISGANPPTTGVSSTVRIDLTVKNTVNDLNDAVLEAVIPRAETQFDQNSITPTDERDNVRYSKTSSTINWRLDTVFALTGTFHDTRTLSFVFTITPGVGESVPRIELLRDIVLSGTDQFTNKKISSNKIEGLMTSN